MYKHNKIPYNKIMILFDHTEKQKEVRLILEDMKQDGIIESEKASAMPLMDSGMIAYLYAGKYTVTAVISDLDANMPEFFETLQKLANTLPESFYRDYGIWSFIICNGVLKPQIDKRNDHAVCIFECWKEYHSETIEYLEYVCQ